MADYVMHINPKAAFVTEYGWQRIGRVFFEKGVHTCGAAGLLEDAGGHSYVVSHLWGLAIELVAKGVLLMKAPAVHQPKLQKPYGHNLVLLYEAIVAEFGLNEGRGNWFVELKRLDSMYPIGLRYGSVQDILQPQIIPPRHLKRRVEAAIRLSIRWLGKRRSAESA